MSRAYGRALLIEKALTRSEGLEALAGPEPHVPSAVLRATLKRRRESGDGPDRGGRGHAVGVECSCKARRRWGQRGRSSGPIPSEKHLLPQPARQPRGCCHKSDLAPIRFLCDQYLLSAESQQGRAARVNVWLCSEVKGSPSPPTGHASVTLVPEDGHGLCPKIAGRLVAIRLRPTTSWSSGRSMRP